MKKSRPKQEEPIMYFNEIVEYIEKKHDIKVRDYANKFEIENNHLERYNANVPKKLRIDGSTQFTSDAYQRFEKWLEDNNLPSHQKNEIPYLDYWHYLVGNVFNGEIHNGEKRYWDLQKILKDKDAPVWVKEITQKIRDEFKGQLDKEGGLVVKIEW